MAKIDELTSAIATCQAAITAKIAALSANTTTDAQVQSAIDGVNAITTQVNS